MSDLSWFAFAACAGSDVDVFFPNTGMPAKPARMICAGCGCRQSCLEYAIDNELRHGIYGGLSAKQRRPLHEARSKLPKPIAHGTERGWQHHRRIDVPVCASCEWAHTENDRIRRAS